MIDIKKLNELKKIIRLECQFIYSDKKKITKEEIEQKVARHVDEKFPNYMHRRQLYEDIRDEMFQLFFTKKGEFIGLSDDKDHEKWFDRKFIENKPFWEIYRQILVEESKMPIEAINDLDKSTDLILSDLEKPSREGRWDRRGMVIGSVQSGKTANFLGLINKARDTGYKFIVILSGANNDLRQQTQQRIDQGYIGLQTYAIYKDEAKEENRLGLLRRSLYSGKYQTPTTGTIDLTVNGGSGSYTFTWDNSAMTEDLTGISNGTYEVTVIDQADNCIFSETFTVINTNTIYKIERLQFKNNST